ncbi:MAG: hypothetical protein MAG451_01221 [Anaerolineales bacterium]|nr:hypothetical protein [Anaerolineales bacterium]
MSIVVSDASPLINLARVEQFDLLAIFYGQIVIPQAVYNEVVVQCQAITVQVVGTLAKVCQLHSG